MQLIEGKLFPGRSDEFKFLLKTWPEYFAKRIRRVIPPADELKERTIAVFNEFQDKKDAKGKTIHA